MEVQKDKCIIGKDVYQGSFGAPDVFPFVDVICAEMITCMGKQCLRHMISHFTNKEFELL